ncbi:hypothetical protein MBAV_002513 [Candidatus Magnetobacterium bavaricum]|uniref:Uncharacterized protein n=1 Tax=Candidatus Magnetobacterium bavaricum TaxID=29290 RepID=A0A0F3GTL7_9BACT|nr:hypothetical protein MBAV_002513 [Candidatus Magnetobacterium bavaricum]
MIYIRLCYSLIGYFIAERFRIDKIKKDGSIMLLKVWSGKLALVFVVLLAFLSGCATYHSYESFLYKKDDVNDPELACKAACELSPTGCKADPVCAERRYVPVSNDYQHNESSNPIYVHADSNFTINITEIRPGWMHEGSNYTDPNTENYNSWTEDRTRAMIDKDLWLIVKVSSLDNSDPLESNSKKYYHATNVKLNSASYWAVPLSDTERIVFKHDADSDYRVTFTLYSVSDFEFKQVMNKMIQDSGLATSAIKAIKAYLKGLVGITLDSFEKEIDSEIKDHMLIERVLLEANSVAELKGSFVVLRTDKLVSDLERSGDKEKMEEYIKTNKLCKHREFLLYDYFKSKKNDKNEAVVASYKNKLEYEKLLAGIEDKYLLSTDNAYKKGAFIRFDIEEIPDVSIALKYPNLFEKLKESADKCTNESEGFKLKSMLKDAKEMRNDARHLLSIHSSNMSNLDAIFRKCEIQDKEIIKGKYELYYRPSCSERTLLKNLGINELIQQIDGDLMYLSERLKEGTRINHSLDILKKDISNIQSLRVVCKDDIEGVGEILAKQGMDECSNQETLKKELGKVKGKPSSVSISTPKQQQRSFFNLRSF